MSNVDANTRPEPMEPNVALHKIVVAAVVQTFDRATVAQTREIADRVEKWLAQSGYEVRDVER